MKSINSGGNPALSVHQKWVDQGVSLAAFCRFRPLNPKKKNQETLNADMLALACQYESNFLGARPPFQMA